MNARPLFLWRYGCATGLWRQVRAVTAETADAWLSIWRADEPAASFRVAAYRPMGKPDTATGFVLARAPE